MESLHNERWIDFEGENLFQFHFLFPAEKTYKQYLLVLLQKHRFKTVCLAFPDFLSHNFVFTNLYSCMGNSDAEAAKCFLL